MVSNWHRKANNYRPPKTAEPNAAQAGRGSRCSPSSAPEPGALPQAGPATRGSSVTGNVENAWEGIRDNRLAPDAPGDRSQVREGRSLARLAHQLADEFDGPEPPDP
jgi:hypothetical protein